MIRFLDIFWTTSVHPSARYKYNTNKAVLLLSTCLILQIQLTSKNKAFDKQSSYCTLCLSNRCHPI